MHRALLAIFVLAACSEEPTPTRTWTPADHAQPPRQEVDPSRVPRRAQQPERPEEPQGEERLRAAATLWRLSCAGCHGTEGRGDGPNAAGELTDLSTEEWQSSVTDQDIARVITLGAPPMPAFGEVIAPAGIAALVEHVRRLGGEDPTPQPSEPTTPAPGDTAASPEP